MISHGEPPKKARNWAWNGMKKLAIEPEIENKPTFLKHIHSCTRNTLKSAVLTCNTNTSEPEIHM